MSQEHFEAQDSLADWGQQFAPQPAECATELGADSPRQTRPGFDWRAFLVRYTTPLTLLFAVVATGIVIASKVMP